MSRPPSLTSKQEGKIGERVPVPSSPPPASVPLFSHVNRVVVLDPGHHLPFLGVWAPSTPDVSHCLRVSKQKVVSTHGSCGPKGSSIENTSLLFVSLHVTEGGSEGLGTGGRGAARVARVRSHQRDPKARGGRCVMSLAATVGSTGQRGP